MQACITKGGVYAGRMPLALAQAIEGSFERLPQALRRRLRLNKGISALLGVALLARKV